MASSQESVSMAVFCDFENVALGVRDAKYDKFDIKPILERLLLKGTIVVKKAYCDWERYKGFKAAMHEANFELIEIPHVRQSGKNSADIRLVVDALDLCYTKAHVDTFVIVSGDSDFSPLVSKLRENAKRVIGVGVKQSTSDLLVANCDDFIFYDDLVRENEQTARKRSSREAAPVARRASGDERGNEERSPKEELEKRRAKGIAIAVETFEALVAERGDSGKIWASVLKEAIKRRRPDFNESYFGFRAFGNLLEAAQTRGLLEFGRDEKSGAYVYRSHGAAEATEPAERVTPAPAPARHAEPAGSDDVAPQVTPAPQGESRRNNPRERGGRQSNQRNNNRPRLAAADLLPKGEFVHATPEEATRFRPARYVAPEPVLHDDDAASEQRDSGVWDIEEVIAAEAARRAPAAPVAEAAPSVQPSLQGLESQGDADDEAAPTTKRAPRKTAAKTAAKTAGRRGAGRSGAAAAAPADDAAQLFQTEPAAAVPEPEADAAPDVAARPARTVRPNRSAKSAKPAKAEAPAESASAQDVPAAAPEAAAGAARPRGRRPRKAESQS